MESVITLPLYVIGKSKQAQEQKDAQAAYQKHSKELAKAIQTSELAEEVPEFKNNTFYELYALIMSDPSKTKSCVKKLISVFISRLKPGDEWGDSIFQFLSLKRLYDMPDVKQEIYKFWSRKKFTKKLIKLCSKLEEKRNIQNYINSQINIIYSLFAENPDYLTRFFQDLISNSIDFYYLSLINSGDTSRISPQTRTQLNEIFTGFLSAPELPESHKTRITQLLLKL